jgi:uncharacterized DUF497 family protein
VEFAWDETKAASNLNKHGVSFEEAKTVFDDERCSADEHWEIIVGHLQQNRLLLVSFTERSRAVRIISASFGDAKGA